MLPETRGAHRHQTEQSAPRLAPIRLQVRGEAFNLFNRTNLALPSNTADASDAGQIFGIQGFMRRMQFGLRLAW